MCSDDIIEEYEEHVQGVFKEVHPVKLGRGMGKLSIKPKEVNAGEPKLKGRTSDINITVKEHSLVKKKPVPQAKKKPPELW